jgi:hypothetical protein
MVDKGGKMNRSSFRIHQLHSAIDRGRWRKMQGRMPFFTVTGKNNATLFQ